MMMMARRSGDDGGVTVASSCKQLHQPGALGNECPTVISKPPHTPCSSFSLALFLNALRRHPPPRAHLQLSWIYHRVVHLRFSIFTIALAHMPGGLTHRQQALVRFPKKPVFSFKMSPPPT